MSGDMDEARVTGGFAAVFAQALRSRGMSLSDLRQRLRADGISVSLAALSYWRAGARHPDVSARDEVLSAIERNLGLEAGGLLRAAAKPSSAAPLAPTGFYPVVIDEPGRLASLMLEAREQLDVASVQDYRLLSIEQTVTVGATGQPELTRNRYHFESLMNVVERVVNFTTSGTANAHRFSVEASAGGRIADEYLSEGCELRAVAFEFDTPLRAGDTGVAELVVRSPPGTLTNDGVWLGVARPTRKIANWVHFHPDAIPDQFREIESGPDGETSKPRSLDTPESIHQVRWDFGPGSIGLMWEYDGTRGRS